MYSTRTKNLLAATIDSSLCWYCLQPLWTMNEVVRICLGNDSSLVVFLHEILVALLLRKVYGILFSFEI